MSKLLWNNTLLTHIVLSFSNKLDKEGSFMLHRMKRPGDCKNIVLYKL